MRNLPVIAAILALILASGCNFPTPTPSPPPPASAPSSMPLPTPRASINPLAVAVEYLSRPRIIAYDPFNNMDNWHFNPATGTPVDGVFELQGSSGWHSSFWNRLEFTEGQAVAIRFEVLHANARSEFVFVTGDWRTPSFRQFGFYNAVVPKGDLFQGTLNLGGYALQGGLNILSNTWYEMILAVGRRGGMLAVVWNPADPAQRVVHDVVGGPNWSGLTWVFLPKVNVGETIAVDDFFILDFGDIK